MVESSETVAEKVKVIELEIKNKGLEGEVESLKAAMAHIEEENRKLEAENAEFSR